MTLSRKQALISGAAWLVISVAFAVVLIDVGVGGIAGPSGHTARSILAAVIIPGYAINFAIMWRSRRGRRAGEIDERDKAIEYRATEITAVVLIVTVYLVCIGLYEAHAGEGSVPTGWLFLLAYGCVVLVSLLHPVVTLILDYTGRFHG
jgi:hypothetical protein